MYLGRACNLITTTSNSEVHLARRDSVSCDVQNVSVNCLRCVRNSAIIIVKLFLIVCLPIYLLLHSLQEEKSLTPRVSLNQS